MDGTLLPELAAFNSGSAWVPLLKHGRPQTSHRNVDLKVRVNRVLSKRTTGSSVYIIHQGFTLLSDVQPKLIWVADSTSFLASMVTGQLRKISENEIVVIIQGAFIVRHFATGL